MESSISSRFPWNVFYLCLIGILAAFSQKGAYAAPNNAKPRARVKHVIMMISDGCGYNHIAATDYYRYGQKRAQVYEHFPVKLGLSTYGCESFPPADCLLLGYDTDSAWSAFDYVNQNATDSASAATAMSTGHKTCRGAIGLDISQQPLIHIAELAEGLGKSTGVVTSVPFSHATPAGFVAHTMSRHDYEGIANEMIYFSAVDVIMGCGNPLYDDDGHPAIKDSQYVGGSTTWNDLTDPDGTLGADADGDGRPDAWTLIQDRLTFQSMTEGDTPDRIIGIPKVYTTLQQKRSGDETADPCAVPLTASVPTLEEMTRAALNILDNDHDGFFLMVEGGAIDWASHANQSGRMIEEKIDFDKSVEAVVAWVKENSHWGETLLIVTSDHECGYLTGLGSDPAWNEIVNNGAGHLPGMEWHSGDHTNSLVPFWAMGDAGRLFNAYAHEYDLVRGPYIDNTAIAQVIGNCMR
ncbi:MAG: alkaline phosphatase [bacterium]